MTPNLPTTIRERMKTTAMPIVYEEACKALAACITIDEAKYFSDKAEALAAWAKIYRSDQAAVEAKRLKLWAYRRMSELADELRPRHGVIAAKGSKGFKGAAPGPMALLQEQGFRRGDAILIRSVGNLPAREFESIIRSPKVPTPSMIANSRKHGSKAWRLFMQNVSGTMGAYCRRNSPSDLAREMTQDEAIRCRKIVLEIQGWLDEFEQHLPKGDA